MRSRRSIPVVFLLCGALLAGCNGETPTVDGAADAGFRPDAEQESPPMVDLRADVNRNGTVDLDDPTEDEGEETWSSLRGAIFLANLDDDQGLCPKSGTDVALEGCHDAADEVVNGDEDLLDMAPLRIVPWPEAPDDAVGRLSVSTGAAPYVRLFRSQAGTFTVFSPEADVLSAGELRAGVDLRLEGRDIVRDTAVWDGFVDLVYTVESSSLPAPLSDTVRMRVAPVILSHHLDPAETVYASLIPDDDDAAAMQDDLSVAIAAAGVPQTLVQLPPQLDASGDEVYDQWTQDLFETGFMSMPAPGGAKVIRVAIRSANVDNPRSKNSPQRPAGKVVFTVMRGKDMAGIAQYDARHDQDMDTLDSFGNTETIPPYSFNGQSYPLGRLYRGSVPDYHPDPKMSKLLESQLVQPPVYVDTSWLLVAHVDETITFVKADTPRGWTVVVNDAALARTMLQEQVAAGNGDVQMFVGKYWYDDNDREYSAQVSISEVLADAEVMAASAEAVIEVEKQLAILKQETGITDAEVLRLPFLHWKQYDFSIAYQVGTVNGISFNDSHYGMPEPHGPIINGRDIMKVQAEAEFAKAGITVHWIEDWNLYHRLMGEVHCGSNTLRKLPANLRWWESGR